MKQFVLSNLRMAGVPKEVIQVVEKSEMGTVVSSPLQSRSSFDLIWGNVCVAGDALHPMTPDIGMGGCVAGEALLVRGDGEGIKKGLEEYARLRRWRSFEITATSAVVGWIQQSCGAVVTFLKDNFLSSLLPGRYLKAADFDCGKL